MRQDSMKDALRARRAKGLDVSIIIGGAEPMNTLPDEAEQKKLGLAPQGVEVTHEDGEEPVGKGVMQMAQSKVPSPAHSDANDDPMVISQELEKMGLGNSSIAARHKKSMQKG